MNVAGKTHDDAVNNIVMLRRYQPYKYAGRFFIVTVGDQIKAYRSLRACQNALTRAKIERAEVTIVD